MACHTPPLKKLPSFSPILFKNVDFKEKQGKVVHCQLVQPLVH